MYQVYDPQRAIQENWKDFFLQHYEDMFYLPCLEGEVALQGNWMFINILVCMPLIVRAQPISRDKHLHQFKDGIFNNVAHARLLTNISRSLEEAGYVRDDFSEDIKKSLQDIHNVQYTHLGDWVGTADIFGMADTILQDDIPNKTTFKYTDINGGRIGRMEEEYREQSKEILTLLSGNLGDDSTTNVFRQQLLCGAVSPGQFVQFVGSTGPRTDTVEKLFGRPVEGCFLGGLTGIMDAAIESRSAAKSKHYNKKEMPNAQYAARRNHIQNSVIRWIYDGSCGSNVYITSTPHLKTIQFYLGRFFLSNEGDLLELTPERYDMVLDRPTKFRDPITCRHTDGYCETCGGTLTRAFSKSGVVGFVSNTNVGAPLTQQVLGTKHLLLTNSSVYEIPESLRHLLRAVDNDIFFSVDSWKIIPTMALGFQKADVAKVDDLSFYKDDDIINASDFSGIKNLFLGTYNPDGTITPWNDSKTNMVDQYKSIPHLSPEALTHIHKNRKEIIHQDGIEWMLLRNFDYKKPIMSCIVLNKSVKLTVDQFKVMIGTGVARYTSANDFFTELSQLVWSRVDGHSIHISVMIKACLITSRSNYAIPIVEDPDDVMFGTQGRIITMRSIGALFAFEKFSKASISPVTYMTPKLQQYFDEFLGYEDIIKRDEYWPPIPEILEE